MALSTAQIAKLLSAMLEPKKGERLLFITDYPAVADANSKKQQELVLRFYNAASELAVKSGVRLLPLVKYSETGKANAELPKTAATHDGGRVDSLPEFISSANAVIAMTRYSASAPLKNIAASCTNLRVVSMPGVTSEMEGAMAADYARIAERGRKLLAVVGEAAGFEIIFDGIDVPRGTKLYMDTRANNWALDDGKCTKAGDFINFPSGELFTPTYEGVSKEARSVFGESKTAGILPVYSPSDKRVAFLKIDRNIIVKVEGDSSEAQKIAANIASDANNANIAELGFGLNEKARIGANMPVLEAEKAGVHIAYGRNDHFRKMDGMVGIVKASVHIDYVYAAGSPIVATVHAVFKNGRKALIAERGKITAV